MTRAATSPEIVKLASDGQWSDVFAFISNPAIVLACRVNELAPINDQRVTITFDGVTSGAYTAALEGMTVLVGSAAGLADHGIGCLSAASTATVLSIIRTSSMVVADNDYITVLQDFGVWVKRDRPAYSNQLTVRKPTIVAGGDRMLELTGANVAAVYALAGCASYVTTCAGATVTNGTTSSPTVTITAAGEYLVQIVGTGSNGAVATTYRIIYVFDAAHPPKNIILTSNSGNDNGWTAAVELYENQSAVRDRAKVVVLAKDYYDGTPGSIGALSGCENVVTLGWISTKNMPYDAEGGSLTFDVQPASWWLDQQASAAAVTMIGTAASADWKHMAALTADMMLWFLLEWHTTCLNSMDAIFSGDTRTSLYLEAAAGSAWSQLSDIGAKIGCLPFVNQYGQIVFSIDTPLIPIADRVGIPVVVSLTQDDWESIDVEIVETESAAQTIVTGQLADGKTICALGGGHTFGRFGEGVSVDGMMASSQAQLNVLAGSLHARNNTPYRFSINNLRGNNRLIEPGNRVGLTLTGADNLAGLAYSGNIIVRSVDRSHNPENGAWEISLDADAETQAGLYATGEVAGIDQDVSMGQGSGGDRTPSFPFPDSFPLPSQTPATPPLPPAQYASTCLDSSPETGPYITGWDRTYINGIAGTNSTIAWEKYTLRSATATNKSYVEFLITNVGLAYQRLHIYGVDGTGATITTGTLTVIASYDSDRSLQMRADFAPASAMQVAGFKLVCDEGLDTTPVPLYVWDRSTAHLEASDPGFGGNLNPVSDIPSGYLTTEGPVNFYVPLEGRFSQTFYGQVTKDRGLWGLTWTWIPNFYTTGMGSYPGTFPASAKLYTYYSYSVYTSLYSGFPGGYYAPPALLTLTGETNDFYYPCTIYNKNVYSQSGAGTVVNAGHLQQASGHATGKFQFYVPSNMLISWALTLSYYFSDTTPNYRLMGLGAPSVYNICPAVQA